MLGNRAMGFPSNSSRFMLLKQELILRNGYYPTETREILSTKPQTCLQVELRKPSWESEKCLRRSKLEYEERKVEERRLDLAPGLCTTAKDCEKV